MYWTQLTQLPHALTGARLRALCHPRGITETEVFRDLCQRQADRAVVGQQPFGGRASGTNDKAGAPLNLLRWLSPRTIKETLIRQNIVIILSKTAFDIQRQRLVMIQTAFERSLLKQPCIFRQLPDWRQHALSHL